jgi:ATP-binding protein involved in chromosome partitioning
VSASDRIARYSVRSPSFHIEHMTTARELERRLESVLDPDHDDDIVSLGLVTDVRVHGGTARVWLAFNTPYAPVETRLCDEIRAVIQAVGLDPDLRAAVDGRCGLDETVLPDVRNAIAIVSDATAVGKTTIATNLAVALESRGARVGLLDADIHGPDVSSRLPVTSAPGITPGGSVVPPSFDGVRVMSTELYRDRDDPSLSRESVLDDVGRRLLEGVEWGRLDYLFVDLPSDSGEVSRELIASLPVVGGVVVSAPQSATVESRATARLAECDVPVLGIVENMSGGRSPECETERGASGRASSDAIQERYDAPLLCRVPYHPEIGDTDGGSPVVEAGASPISDRLDGLVDEVLDQVSAVNRRRVIDARRPLRWEST